MYLFILYNFFFSFCRCMHGICFYSWWSLLRTFFLSFIHLIVSLYRCCSFVSVTMNVLKANFVVCHLNDCSSTGQQAVQSAQMMPACVCYGCSSLYYFRRVLQSYNCTTHNTKRMTVSDGNNNITKTNNEKAAQKNSIRKKYLTEEELSAKETAQWKFFLLENIFRIKWKKCSYWTFAV